MFHLIRENQGTAVPIHRMNASDLDAYLKDQGDFVKRQIEAQRFVPKKGKWLTVLGEQGQISCVLAGVRGSEDPRAVLMDFAQLAKALPAGQVYCIAPGQELDEEQAVLGWGLGGYQFNRFKKKKSPAMAELVVPTGVDFQRVTDQLEAIYLARDLVNTPPSHLGPQDMATKAKEVARRHGAKITVIEGEDLLKENYPAVHAVGRGSDRPPLLIDLRWGEAHHPKLTLVGKGVVFDTGGLNLKGASGMILMKKDMGGGGVTLALAQLIMSQALPVRLRLLLPAVENSPGSKAYRPSDVIETRKGISVEIGNTDAEGRVILCDALAEAVSESPELIIDMATLTGAARVALGQDLPGFWTPSDAIADQLVRASRQACDPIWRMPLWLPYRENLDSKVADINNMSNTGMGGSITAALYLHEFVKPFENWVHFDAYCWRKDAIPGTPKGGEASALRAIFNFLEARYPRS